MKNEMQFELKDGINYVLLKIAGKVSAGEQTTELMDAVNDCIEAGKNQFIVDLSELKFVDSSGLSIFLTLLTHSRTSGGDTMLINLPLQLSKLLVITKLNSIFTVPEGLPEAEAALVGEGE